MKDKKESKKFEADYCPNCKDVKMVRLESGEMEVFECENCKFKTGKKKR